MRTRDKNIRDDLIRFRCMSRDDIKELYFRQLKNPIGNCNAVLKRMYLQGLIERNANVQPYIYFPKEKPIKKDSAKIPHFLEIVKVYKDMISYTNPTTFLVEPKYGKGYMEPDIFTIWKGAPLWIEVQRSHYTDEVMNEKIARYEAFYDSGLIKEETWQPKEYPVFPSVLIISPVRYPVTSNKIQIMQAKSIREFMMTVDKPKVVQSKGITIKVGK